MVAKPSATPPLENGDRLNRYEFERRYAAMPNLKNAELIEGVVYTPAALRFNNHGRPHAQIMTMTQVLSTLQQGLDSEEHQEFVKKLER